ncbi:hypothetical protein L6Q21_08615 [Sandaracinobacter sp. RS1-74]|uniref:hypothetical protein n=1 Tax=Sandaracinobacteroides sayramensis TaxID=2913411 RepID=UPI001EDB0127|nr:hypothetical protein [Sandaracinobacteroides sayramensis]MCG2841043.1 hypothetical protein [Sandaracinobacteroides sayramensis]
MARATTIIVTLLTATLFAWAVPLARLYGAFQPLIVTLSIMVAAVFVRLNRGMPALEWKSLDPDKRKELTASIVSVTTEYGWIIGINAVALAGLVTLSVIGATDAALWSEGVRRIVAGTVGGLVTLCAARMAYVVWRDIDIVRLQKHLIDGAASRETDERERALADDKLASMRATNVRPVDIKPPKAWGE